MFRHTVIRLLAPLLMLVVACSPTDEAADVVTVTSESAASEPADDPSPTGTPSPEGLLEDRYYQDSDGNAIPDFMEEQLGHDPAADDCLVDECPDAAPLLTPEGDVAAEENTLLILDSSGSMAGDDGAGTIKMDAASAALERFVVGTPDTTNLGLLVYGHRGNNDDSGRDESCAGIEVFAPLGELDAESVPDALGRFEPTGWTPIGASLDRAGEIFAGTEGADNRVILVTDGIETCDGDPVASARELADSGVAVTVDVVGFDVETDADRRALEGIAEASGGTYTDARDAAQLDDYVDSLLRQRNDALSASICLKREVGRARTCQGHRRREAEALIREEQEDEPRDSPRYEALEQLIQAMFDRSVGRSNELASEYAPAVERLEEALREAQERYERDYGRPISLSPVPCPYLNGSVALASTTSRLPA